jgi:hypothetical protein
MSVALQSAFAGCEAKRSSGQTSSRSLSVRLPMWMSLGSVASICDVGTSAAVNATARAAQTWSAYANGSWRSSVP